MKKSSLALLVCIVIITSLLPGCDDLVQGTRQNTYPIILVPGFGGNDKIMGSPYYGGSHSIEEDLNNNGYETYTANIGPFSSNWDRACELYAQIKGGTVDYGKDHSDNAGHARYGKTYPGFFPHWGDVDPATGNVKKIHLIGHSMGGQTVRLLAQLMEAGSAEELAATGSDTNAFFSGGKSWISGVVTISASHNGTSLMYMIPTEFVSQMVGVMASIVGAGQFESLYDFGFDQWGLQRNKGESFRSYLSRVNNSGIWTETHDIGTWDLNPLGAQEFNSWVNTQPDIYYFSQATSDTSRKPGIGYYQPNSTMNFLLKPFATMIGKYTQNELIMIDKTYWENDGMGSTITHKGPFLGSTDQIVEYNGIPEIGKWNYLGVLTHTDHFAAVGLTGNDQRPLYFDYAELLGSLDK
ncbi:MAG: lipase [Proteobacteria bacterium]|nr:lipase [Pseudomonadota bacterium]